jgi:hypothetical protein
LHFKGNTYNLFIWGIQKLVQRLDHTYNVFIWGIRIGCWQYRYITVIFSNIGNIEKRQKESCISGKKKLPRSKTVYTSKLIPRSAHFAQKSLSTRKCTSCHEVFCGGEA